MPRRLTIIVEDFDACKTAEGTMSIKDGQATNPAALVKMVERINDELNAKTKLDIKIIAELPPVLNA